MWWDYRSCTAKGQATLQQNPSKHLLQGRKMIQERKGVWNMETGNTTDLLVVHNLYFQAIFLFYRMEGDAKGQTQK